MASGSSRPGEELTSKQLAIVRLLVAGRTIKEIAWALGLSDQTVYEHLANIRVRMRARTLAHIAAIAVSAGLAHPDGMPELE